MKISKISIGLVAFASAAIAIGHGCSSVKPASLASVDSSSQSSGALNSGSLNQAPRISCNLDANGHERTIATLANADTTWTPNPNANDPITFDCSATQATSQVTYAIDTNYNAGSPNFLPISDISKYVLSFSTQGIHPVAIKATDANGTSTIKSFDVILQCAAADQVTPQVNIGGIKVSAASNGMKNYFKYSVDPASVNGGNNFQFAWDFDGDGLYDMVSLSNPASWTSPNQYSVDNVYTVFATTPGSSAAASRTINLKVRNGCGLENYVSASINNFDIPNIARNSSSLATPQPYYYLQADVRSSTSPSNQRVNGDYIATQDPHDTAPFKRVQCSYTYTRNNQPAVFKIQGYNTYVNPKNANTDVSVYQKGMDITVAGIPDNGSQGVQSYTQSNGVSINSANFRAAASGDSIPADLYQKSAACTVHISVQRAKATTPCAAGQTSRADFSESDVVQIYGEFNCPTLTSSAAGNSTQVAANNGKYFCEIGPTQQCIGGGGGGGGAPPPQQ